MIRRFIANYQEFERFAASLDKIIPHLPKTLTQVRKEIVASENSQVILDLLLGQSPVMLKLKNKIKRFAPRHQRNVFITGESGTGKELIAQGMHFLSPRWKQPFSPLNCAELSEERYADVLYGHVKGAFTGADTDKKGVFEDTGKGTVFLDEIGELSLPVQAGLLRTLQEKTIIRVGGTKILPIECRIIMATNRDLEAAVSAGSFREDLYYRILDGARIHSPDLAERGEDSILLTLCLVIKEILDERGSAGEGWQHGSDAVSSNELITLHKSYFQALESHDFCKGNVRELSGIVRQSMFERNSNILTADDFFASVAKSAGSKCSKQSQHNHGLAQRIKALLEGKAGIQPTTKEHIAIVLATIGNTYFSPKAFIAQMRRICQYHENTCRKYLRYLFSWGIVKHNEKKTSGVRYLLAIA